MTRVLCVCLGNICRSPAAEGMLRQLAPDLTVDSAGTGRWHIGEPPHRDMIATAAARGIDLTAQRARQFTADDFTNFDVIFAMDAQNAADIETLRPRGNNTPVYLFAGTPVPDPYYTGDFTGCLDVIETAARRWINDKTLRQPG